MGSLSADRNDIGTNDVKTTVNHMLPERSENRRYVCAGGALSTAAYGAYDVVMRDVRPIKEQCRLETKGFELATFPTKVRPIQFHYLERG